MKKTNKVSAVILSIMLILGLTGSTTTFAATDPGLGAAATFSIIAQTAITGTGTISGDVGLNSTGAGITALTAGNVSGTIYSTDGVAPSTAILDAQVQANLSSANDNTSGQGSTASVGPVLDGEILTTGVYDIGAGRLNGGILTLDGPGMYILRASSDFVSSGSITLTNGARACDVYWQVNTLATINGSSFVGTIIAGTGVHFGDSVELNGRALALGGDVTLLNNTISGPTCATPVIPDPVLEPEPEVEVVQEAEETIEVEIAQEEVVEVEVTQEETIEEEIVSAPVVAENVVPKLPNTGISPDNKSSLWNVILLAGILAIATSLYFVQRKQIA